MATFELILQSKSQWLNIPEFVSQCLLSTRMSKSKGNI